jgi:hypothetical protein
MKNLLSDSPEKLCSSLATFNLSVSPDACAYLSQSKGCDNYFDRAFKRREFGLG